MRNEPFRERWGRRLDRLRRWRQGKPSAATHSQGLAVESKVPEQLEEHSQALGRMTSQTPSLSAMIDATNRIPATMPLEGGDIHESPFRSLSKSPDPPGEAGDAQSTRSPPALAGKPARPPLLTRAAVVLQNVPMATWSVAAGLLCSLVQPLKALLAPTDGWTGGRMPSAPDGNPPLFFLLDTAAYIGALTVPLGLMLLGSSFARLQLPARIRDAPISANIAMALCKSAWIESPLTAVVVVPVFAVFVVQAFQSHTALFPKEDKIRTFCAILLSGTPAAVNQLVVTQLYNPAGRADTLAFFLLLQYCLMFVLSTALAAIALYIVK